MGITGLLPFLKKCSRPANLSEFKGKTAAIDAYCWLHKGVFSCADKIVKGEPTVGYIIYVMKQVNVLLSFNIKPILVFDGCHLPSKAITETKRRENREKNRAKAKQLLRDGKIKEARECFQRCVDVTSEMARQVIEACRDRNIDIIVAPYEADSELAFLNREKIADFVITEDSDLILFGCDKVLFKLDHNGIGCLVESDKLHLSMSLPRDKFSFERFLHMCILSGCDYLPSLHGIGLGKACKFFTVVTNPDVHSVLCRLPSYLKMPSLEVTTEYRDNFMKAINTFKHQLVFNPLTRKLVPLLPHPNGMDFKDFPYAGHFMGHDRALQIALGNVNVQTGEVVANYNPDLAKPLIPKSSGWQRKGDIITNHPSIWRSDFNGNWSKAEVKESKVPVLNAINNNTLGKVKVIPTNNIKRKIDAVDDKLLVDIDGDLQQLYGTVNKKLKSEYNLSIDEGSEGFEEKEVSLHHSMEDDDEGIDVDNSQETKENKVPDPSSRNPFAKKSPSEPSSKLFTALKNFSKAKTTVSTTTIVQSRFFGPIKSDSSPSSIKKEELSDSDPEDDSSFLHKLSRESNNGANNLNSDSIHNHVTPNHKFTFKRFSNGAITSPTDISPLFKKNTTSNPPVESASSTTSPGNVASTSPLDTSNSSTLSGDKLSSPFSSASQLPNDKNSQNSVELSKEISTINTSLSNYISKKSNEYSLKSPPVNKKVINKKIVPSSRCGKFGLSKTSSSSKQLTLSEMFSFSRKK